VLTDVLNRKKTGAQDSDLERLVANRDHAERRAVDGLYRNAVEDRVKEISDRLRAEIAEELRTEYIVELETRLAAIRTQYEGLLHDGGKLPSSTPALIEEIASTQAGLLKKEIELARGLADDAFSFGAIVQLRTEKLELESYLRGLNFRSKTLYDTQD
jgi:vacuolar-type H+-ATPase subunit I/STV1